MSETRTVPLPLSAERWAYLQATFPLSADEFERLMTILHAMKPAIVAISHQDGTR